MTISYRSAYGTAGNFQPGSLPGTFTLTKPSGTASGDYLLAVLVTDTSYGMPTPPSGFELISRGGRIPGQNIDRWALVYGKYAGGSEPSSYSWTLNSPAGPVGFITSYPGVQGVARAAYYVEPSASKTHPSPSIYVDAAGQWVVRFVAEIEAALNQSACGHTPPSGHTERLDQVWNPASQYYVAGSIADRSDYAVGPTGTASFTNASYNWTGMHVVVVLSPTPTDWAADANCAVATVASDASDGSNALQLTASTAATMRAHLAQAAWRDVRPSTQYTALAKFKGATAGRTCAVKIRWYNSAGSLISESPGTGAADNTSTYTQLTVTATSPATAIMADVVAEVQSPGASEVHRVDAIALNEGSVTTFARGEQITLVDTYTASDSIGQYSHVTGFVTAESKEWFSIAFSPTAANNQVWRVTPGAAAPAKIANEEFSNVLTVTADGDTHAGLAHDGTQFWTISRDGVLVKHTNWSWASSTSTYYVKYTWRDSTNGYETLPSLSFSTRAMVRRALMYASPASFPGGVDQFRVYMLRAASPPADTALHLQVSSVTVPATISTDATGGAAPPTSNTFPGTTPSYIATIEGGFKLDGSGLLELPKITPAAPTRQQLWIDPRGTPRVDRQGLRGGGGWPSAKFTRSTTKSIPAGNSTTNLTKIDGWNTEVWDDLGLSDSSGDIAVPYTGIYIVAARATFDVPGATFDFGIRIKNETTGVTIVDDAVQIVTSTVAPAVTCAMMAGFTAGDSVSLYAAHNDGTNAHTVQSGEENTSLAIIYLGPLVPELFLGYDNTQRTYTSGQVLGQWIDTCIVDTALDSAFIESSYPEISAMSAMYLAFSWMVFTTTAGPRAMTFISSYSSGAFSADIRHYRQYGLIGTSSSDYSGSSIRGFAFPEAGAQYFTGGVYPADSVTKYNVAGKSFFGRVKLGQGDVAGMVASAVNFSVPTASVTKVTYTKGVRTVYGAFTYDGSGNVTPGIAGKYLVIGQVSFAYNTSGYRRAMLRKNGTTVFADETTRPTADSNQVNVMPVGVVSLSATDTVDLSVYQNSGSSLSLQAGQIGAAIGFVWLGP